jgi:ribosomal protein S27AE
MVDRDLTCTRTGCGGVAKAQGSDLRSNNIKYKCGKCGNVFTVPRMNIEAGKHSFNLGDPRDYMRSGVK